MVTRRKMTNDAKEITQDLMDYDPRIAVLVAATFLERRLLTILANQLNAGENRKKVRQFLDERLQLGSLIAIGNILDIIPSEHRQALDSLLQERNRIAHKYKVWRKLNDKHRSIYREKWAPVCNTVIEFMEQTAN